MIKTISQLFTQLINSLDTIQFSIGENSVSLSSILEIVIYFCLILILCNYFQRLLKNTVLAKLGIDEGNRTSLATIISYSFGTILFIVIIQAQGFNLSSLAVIAGGLGVGIGFGLQEITRNFVSGITLLVERSLKVGDFVELDEDTIGYVKEISIRSTIIRTFDGSDIILPNTNIVNSRLVNWSYDSFVARTIIPVKVPYGSDPVLVTELLLKSAYMEPNVLREPVPLVIFVDFGENWLQFDLRVWVSRIDDRITTKSSLRYIIEYNLRTHGIQMAIPQRDVWLRNPETITDKLLYLSNDLDKIPPELLEGQSTQEFRKGDTCPYPSVLIRDLLQQVSYFRNFNELELRQLIEIGYRQRLQPSEILFRENDPGDAFYIVLSGSVEVYVDKINKHLTDLYTGQFFGELSLMLGIPRTATVRANEETMLFTITKKEFEKLLRKNHEFYEAIVRELSSHREELAERQKQLRELGLLSVGEDDTNPVVWVRNRLQKLFSLEIG